jgi:hypothetical protein
LTTQRFHLASGWRGRGLAIVLVLVLLPILKPIHLAAAPTVTLQAQIFLASNQPGAAPDARLAGLIAQLRKALPYSSFQPFLPAPSGRIEVGKVWRTELPGGEVQRGRVLELTPMAIDRAAIQIQARVIQAKIVQGKTVSETLVNTTLRLQSGGPPFVIGGPAYQNGVLVIVISASAP